MKTQILEMARGKSLEARMVKVHDKQLFFLKDNEGQLLNEGQSLDAEEALQFIEHYMESENG